MVDIYNNFAKNICSTKLSSKLCVRKNPAGPQFSQAVRPGCRPLLDFIKFEIIRNKYSIRVLIIDCSNTLQVDDLLLGGGGPPSTAVLSPRRQRCDS
jgi:hypothetical protein